MPHQLRNLFTQHTSHGSRSTALNPLQWILGLLLTSTTSAVVAGAPIWLLTALSCGIGLVILQMIFAYNYLLIKDRDALRSESYTLNKLAIEKGLIGDSDAGVVNVEAKNVSGQQLLGQQIIQDDPK